MRIKLLLIIFLISYGSYGQDSTFSITPVPVQEVTREQIPGDTPQAIAEETTTIAAASSPEIGETQGALSVSLTGGATYTVPIKVPPGIDGIEPEISLTYNSQGGNGLAGFGWNLSGISVITRVAPTPYHDGAIQGVTLEDTDRFALDGQRLLLKSGTYGQDGAVYQTENFSNLLIKSFGNYYQGPAYFKITYPDGSVAVYGHNSNSRSRMDYAISYWENPQGIRVSYQYTQANNSLSISKISYGSKGTQTPVNEIQFEYENRSRPEQSYVGGQRFVRKNILKKIKVLSSGQGYRSYVLNHNSSPQGYQRLSSITELNGGETSSFSPIQFTYTNTTSAVDKLDITATLTLRNMEQRNAEVIAFDLDGNGVMDFTVQPKDASERNKFWLFDNIQDQVGTIMPHRVEIGTYQELFPINWKTSVNKVSSGQGLVAIQYSGADKVHFKVMGYHNYALLTDKHIKTWSAPTFSDDLDCGRPGPAQRIPRDYISGNFKGDGLTQILALSKPYRQRNCYPVLTLPGEPCPVFPEDPTSNDDQQDPQTQQHPEAQQESLPPRPPRTDCCRCETTNRGGRTQVHLIDLDPNLPSGFATSAGYLDRSVEASDELITGDVNGDGKTDLLHIQEGVVDVYTLEGNQIRLLFRLTHADIKLDFPILAGDYNGDGKLDLMIPTAVDSSRFVTFLATGTGFYRISSYQPFTYKLSNWDGHDGVGTMYGHHLVPTDINGDGKTDIISYNTTTYNNSTTGNQQLSTYINVPSSSGMGNPEYKLSTGAYHTGTLKHYPIPIFLNSEKRNSALEFASISDNKVTSFKFNQDHREDMLMRSTVKNGVTQRIDYVDLSPKYYPQLGYVYQQSFDQTYPNQDIERARGLKVVAKLVQSGSNIPSLEKLFTYYGAVTNFEGRGFLGFKSLGMTNWYEGVDERIWNVTRYDLSQRGAVSMEYFSTSYPNLHVDPTDYISKTTYQYDSELLPNKVFKLHLESSLEQNTLNGTHINRDYQYDSYGNPLRTTTNFSGQGQQVVEATYSNSTSGSDYHIGRPLTKTTSSTIGGNTFSTEESYTYNGYLLSKKQTRGHNTNDFVEERYTYNDYGNLISTTLQPSGEAARTSRYEYDDTQRFVIKQVDPEGLETNYEYSSRGNLLQETDPFGLTTQYGYDTWNRLIKVTNYLGNEVQTAYEKSGYDYTLTTTGDDGSMEVSTYNKLQQLVQEQYKDVLGQLVTRQYEYDSQGRIKRESEPFLGGSPSQWNTTEYDRYGRVVRKTSYTGKEVNISYDGLTTTVDDGTKVETTTTDAMGNMLSKTQAGAGQITYTYFGNGNLKSASYDGVTITVEQDGWGRKTKLVDPSAGTYTYQYNGYGEVIEETNPKGQISYTYDTAGRVEQKKLEGDHTDLVIDYQYDPQTKLLRAISQSDAQGNSSQYGYHYDGFRRMIQEQETTPYAQFTRKYTFNNLGQVETEESIANSLVTGGSSSKKIRNTYQNGGLINIQDPATGQVLWELEELNARGQTLASTVGNDLKKRNTYDPMGFLTQIRTVNGQSAVGEELMRLEFGFDAQRGLLNSRHNSLFNWNETFDYDSLDRLTEFNDNRGNHSQSYDARGRIIQNSLIGTYGYSADSYRQSSLNLNTSGQDYFDQLDYQDISFNAFKKPVQIAEAGKDKLDFDYNAFEGRANMFYGGTQIDKTQRRYQKHYGASGSMEIKIDKVTGEADFVLYLGGDAYSAPIIWHSRQSSSGTQENYYYLHRDYLGSILAITDADGDFKEKRHFDAWGNVVKLEDGNGNVLSSFDILDRGYTGHEHLLSVGIINMNGRLYDPLLHRFLSPDNFVQDPYNTQNFNRYGYVLNNPLKYTDPSGEFLIAALFGAAIGVITNGIGNLIQDKGFFKGAVGAAFFGAVGGTAAFGIGEITTTIASSIGNVAAGTFQAGAHSLLGGALSVAQGGEFGAGVLSGAISSGIASGMNGIKIGSKILNSATKIGASGISGGFGSMIAGGDFMDGFRQGLISGGLNHGIHSGWFGSNIQYAAITQKPRHLFGPDAYALGGSITANPLFGLKMGKGGILPVRGSDKGVFSTYDELGFTGGTPTVSIDASVTKLYYSGRASQITTTSFVGHYHSLSLGVDLGASIGVSGVYSNLPNGKFVIGGGVNVGLGFSPILLDAHYTYGSLGRNRIELFNGFFN